MARRKSGYERRKADLYETPEWVTQALLDRLALMGLRIGTVWEPTCASGKMVRALSRAGYTTHASDIRKGKTISRVGTGGVDFLKSESFVTCDAIITNPPYKLARQFIEASLDRARVVAMLLPSDYDFASTRQHLFSNCPWFAMKLQLTTRISWFENSKGTGPSENHAWFVWVKGRHATPVVRYYVRDKADDPRALTSRRG